MIPDHNNKLTQQILADSVPEWESPGFTNTMMRQIVAAGRRKTRHRWMLILSGFIAVIALTAYALVHLLKLKPTALSPQVDGLEQLGAWLAGKESLLLPLVLLLLTKTLIDSRHRHEA